MSNPDVSGNVTQTSSFDHHMERQITLQLNPEQYERLFFQPTAAKGDLAKRLGNPTLLGIIGFLVPYTSIVFSLLNFQGSNPTSLTSFSGCFYFFGGIAMSIAGICEFILGNTFPFIVFIVYGCHWVTLAYTDDPAHGLASSYGGAEGGLSQEYNAGLGNYNVVMAMVSFIFLVGSVRTNLPFVINFLGLVLLYSFLAAGFYHIGHQGAAGVEQAYTYFKIAGGFGFAAMIFGWYLAIITVCASTGVPCPLPIFDLSQKFLAYNEDAMRGEHAGAVREKNVKA